MDAVDDDDIFDKLANDACKNNLQNETWLNLYGRTFANLSVTDIDENASMAEFSTFADGLVESLFGGGNVDMDDNTLSQALHSLRSFLSPGEYPKIKITLTVVNLIKEGIDGNTDSTLIVEASRLMSQLLRHIPPSRIAFRQYWYTVLFKSICGDSNEDGSVNLRLREKFVEILDDISQFAKEQQPDEKRLQAAGAYLRIICEILEIDLTLFLNKNRQNVCSAALVGRCRPHIATIFWPHQVIQVGSMQRDFLEPIIKISTCTRDMQMYDVCSRFLAMIYEITRLTGTGQTAEKVSLDKTLSLLNRLLKEVPFFFDTDAIDRACDSTAFGWVKTALRNRQKELYSTD